LGDGIILGVGTLLTALPNIIILFFFLSLMEDTGYMARIAYLMDDVMHLVGLHGRSAIPLLMGFDCNVPAIIAAKDIIDKKDRTLTMLMVYYYQQRTLLNN
jgi:ferrous iron transport protein B